MKKRQILAAIIFTAMLAIAWYVQSSLCFDVFPSSDSAVVQEQEASELLSGVRVIYRNDTSRVLGKLPAPINVTISGKTARLIVSGPLNWGHLEYAQEWQRVYQKHHGGSRCVTLMSTWKGGSIVQHFPPDVTI